MWPNKNGLGVQLGFGVEGSALYSENTNSEQKWRFARERDLGLQLIKVHRSHKQIVPPQRSIFDSNPELFSISSYLDDEIFVPDAVLKEFLIESKNLSSDWIYDPSYGKLLDIGKVKTPNGRKILNIVAYSSGSSGTILNISFLRQNKRVIDREGSKVQISSPSLVNAFSIQVTSPIKQVVFPNLVSSLEITPPYLAIRTDEHIYILKIFLDNNDSLEAKLVGEIPSSRLASFPFQDISFNPWDFTQFAAIDSKGNFNVWDIRDVNIAKIQALKLDNNRIIDVSDLSNWKKIAWGNNMRKLMLFSRSSVVEYDMDNMERKEVVTAKAWSDILDFERCSYDSKFGFILTSKELIWIQFDSPIRRLISWRHFLEDQDPSLKLTVTNYHSDIICLVSSQIHSLTFVYQFGIRDGLPVSLHDPYFISTGFSTRTQSLLLVPSLTSPGDSNNVDEYEETTTNSADKREFVETFALLQLSTVLEISYSLYSHGVKMSLNRLTAKVSEESISAQSRNKKFFTGRFKRNEFAEYARMIINGSIDSDKKSDTEIVQDHAYKIGDYFNKILADKETDTTVAYLMDSNTSIVEDVGEFDSMITQLKSHFSEGGIVFHDDSDFIKKELGSNIEEIYARLKSESSVGKENSIKNEILREISIVLGLSLVRFSSRSRDYNEELKIRLDNVPADFKRLVDVWDNIDDEEEDDIAELKATQSTQRVEIPVINVSQSQATGSQLPSNNRSRSMVGGFSQRSSGSRRNMMGSSQLSGMGGSQGSSQRRKKKRKGGFA